MHLPRVVMGHILLELVPGLVSGAEVFDFDGILGLVRFEDDVSVLSLHSHFVESVSDLVRDGDACLHVQLIIKTNPSFINK